MSSSQSMSLQHSPQQTIWGYIFIIRRDGSHGKGLAIDSPDLVFGKSENADIRIMLPGVDDIHATLTVNQDGKAVLTKKGKFDTWLDGQLVEHSEIVKDGSVFKICERSFVFCYPESKVVTQNAPQSLPRRNMAHAKTSVKKMRRPSMTLGSHYSTVKKDLTSILSSVKSSQSSSSSGQQPLQKDSNQTAGEQNVKKSVRMSQTLSFASGSQNDRSTTPPTVSDVKVIADNPVEKLLFSPKKTPKSDRKLVKVVKTPDILSPHKKRKTPSGSAKAVIDRTQSAGGSFQHKPQSCASPLVRKLVPIKESPSIHDTDDLHNNVFNSPDANLKMLDNDSIALNDDVADVSFFPMVAEDSKNEQNQLDAKADKTMTLSEIAEEHGEAEKCIDQSEKPTQDIDNQEILPDFSSSALQPQSPPPAQTSTNLPDLLLSPRRGSLRCRKGRMSSIAVSKEKAKSRQSVIQTSSLKIDLKLAVKKESKVKEGPRVDSIVEDSEEKTDSVQIVEKASSEQIAVAYIVSQENQQLDASPEILSEIDNDECDKDAVASVEVVPEKDIDSDRQSIQTIPECEAPVEAAVQEYETVVASNQNVVESIVVVNQSSQVEEVCSFEQVNVSDEIVLEDSEKYNADVAEKVNETQEEQIELNTAKVDQAEDGDEDNSRESQPLVDDPLEQKDDGSIDPEDIANAKENLPAKNQKQADVKTAVQNNGEESSEEINEEPVIRKPVTRSRATKKCKAESAVKNLKSEATAIPSSVNSKKGTSANLKATATKKKPQRKIDLSSDAPVRRSARLRSNVTSSY
ncbi:hypothetical protein MIR68_009780 [Amoeboaphelidium protococcarum]|nr:hypothetical protein MIR68_009780 [Amoeboaphelidium protococcarum]